MERHGLPQIGRTCLFIKLIYGIEDQLEFARCIFMLVRLWTLCKICYYYTYVYLLTTSNFQTYCKDLNDSFVLVREGGVIIWGNYL